MLNQAAKDGAVVIENCTVKIDWGKGHLNHNILS